MCKKVFLGVVLCLAVVFAGCQTCPSKDEAKALPKGYCGYGAKVRVTYSLFQGQTLGYLFAADTKAKDVFTGWKRNADRLDDSSGLGNAYLALLKQRGVELEQASAGLGDSVTYRSLFTSGAAALPQPVLAKLNALEQMGVDLPFLHPVDTTTFDNIVKNLLDMGFGGMDLYALYHTPADPAIFSDAHIDAIDAALDAKILRFGSIDFLCTSADGDEMVPKAANMCCSKTTRKCVQYSGLSCSMCGTYCCLASNWCP